MTDTHVLVSNGVVRITNVQVARKDVADFFRSIPEEQWELTCVQALELGVFCLERTRMGQDVEFVRRQIESLLTSVESTVEKIPDRTQQALIEKIGTNEGQVLAPVQNLIKQVFQTTALRLDEVRNLLAQEIDPAKETSTLGKALYSLRNLLDPKRTDSIQGSLEASIKEITGKDGALSSAVKAVVAESIKPLAAEIDKLAKEVRGQEAAEEALANTTAKGAIFEEEILPQIRDWAEVAGAEVSYVGTDNRPGDVLIKLTPESMSADSLTIVIEAKDRSSPAGRKVIAETLNIAMSERNANAAIYLSRTTDGFAREIGEWAEGTGQRGPFIACTHDHLTTALRFLVVQERLSTMRAKAPEVDCVAIGSQVQRLRTALDRVRNINRNVSSVCSSAANIQMEAEALRNEARDALSAIEDALRSAPKTWQTVVPINKN